MPNLADRPASKLVKTILMGDGGTGKTSALASLVGAGYKLRIMDFDNQLTPLVKLIKLRFPDKMANVTYLPFHDKLKTGPSGPVLDGPPQAFINALKILDHWRDGDEDLGPPRLWGPGTVLVLDSFTRFGDAAERWADFFQVKPGKGTGQKDYRDVIGEAQSGLTHFLNTIRAESFNTNVILICHVSYQDGIIPGALKMFPKAPGKKLSPDIPTYFESYLLAENTNGTRQIRTAGSPLADLKNAATFDMPATLPIDTGLAEFFKRVTA